MRFLDSVSIRWALPFVAILLACVMLILDPLPLQTLRNGVFDQYQRWHPRVYQDVGVRIVDIDDESLRRLGQWPWPREKMAVLTEALQNAGASSIAFDVLFAEPDRTSPSAFVQRWPLAAEARNRIAALPDPDRQFADALRKGKVVLGIAEGAAGSRISTPEFGLIIKGAQDSLPLPRLAGTVSALPVLASAADGNGAITFMPDADGIVRHIPMLVAANGVVLPSLVTESLRISEHARNVVVHAESSGISQVDIGQFHVPTSADGQFWVHFTKPVPNRTIPAWRVMAADFSDAGLRNSMVVIGTSAQGLQDLRFSPLGGVIPGVEVHAQALEQIKAGHWLERPRWALPLEALTMLIAGIALIVLALRSSAVVSAIGSLLVLLCLNWFGWLAFRDHQLLLDVVMPSIGILLAYVLASISRHMATEAKQKWIQQAFARYVSPNRVAYLMANPAALELGGRRQECSFVFTDLTNFTGLVEKASPDAAVGYLNDYLEGMIQIAFRYEGTLDRIVGDALAIMFSAPTPQPDHQARALACAIDMQRFAEKYAASLQAQNIAFGTTRIGVHSGDVVVGNFGGKTIFDYRAMGDAVNIAARLETLNRHVGTTMCVSSVIKSACPDTPMRAVGQIVLKGKTEPVAVFEPLNAIDVDYDAAYALLASGHVDALHAFESLNDARKTDRLLAFHLARLRAGAQNDVIVMEEK